MSVHRDGREQVSLPFIPCGGIQRETDLGCRQGQVPQQTDGPGQDRNTGRRLLPLDHTENGYGYSNINYQFLLFFLHARIFFFSNLLKKLTTIEKCILL